MSAPDLVRLVDGGMVRGTIAELVAGERVVILSLTGETRVFPMDQVRYAGPAADEPRAPSPPPEAQAPPQPQEPEAERRPFVTVHATEARLRLQSPQPEVTFYVPSASARAVGPGGTATARGYDRICTAPCEASLPSGSYRLALAREDGPTIESDEPLYISGDAVLTGTYNDRSGVRLAGWLVLAAAVVGGIGVVLGSDVRDSSTLPLSMGIILAGGVLSTILVLQSDSVEIGLEQI